MPRWAAACLRHGRSQRGADIRRGVRVYTVSGDCCASPSRAVPVKLVIESRQVAAGRNDIPHAGHAESRSVAASLTCSSLAQPGQRRSSMMHPHRLRYFGARPAIPAP
jgi:hypothetical protein